MEVKFSNEGCLRKHRYPSPRSASEVAARMSKRGRKADTYKCPNCRGWHVKGTVKPVSPQIPPVIEDDDEYGEYERFVG